jgi:hypothetical protein
MIMRYTRPIVRGRTGDQKYCFALLSNEGGRICNKIASEQQQGMFTVGGCT